MFLLIGPYPVLDQCGSNLAIIVLKSKSQSNLTGYHILLECITVLL